MSEILLEDTDRYRLWRRGRYLAAAFKRPHRVLSSSRCNGGLREDLTHIANHQSCEGVGHAERHLASAGLTLAESYRRDCAAGGLPAATTALMATAANMQCAVLAEASHADLAVTVAATAGVLGNATRAGDPAGWHEYPDGSRPLDQAPDRDAPVAPEQAGSGTIVTLVFINQPCTPGCLVRAASLVTEGKSAALLDLRMPSLQSSALATGTGTDQFAIAAPLARAGEWERHWAGGHHSLGELLGRATHQAVTRCLLLQNGVCAELRRSVTSALGRLGCDAARLVARAQADLEPAQAALFSENLQALLHDPQSAAAAYGLAEILDLTRAGVLHPEVAREALLNQAALLAAAVAVQPERFAELREALREPSQSSPADLAAAAMIQGFQRKWN